MTIGTRIKSLRESKGITQTELAELIGTTKQNIYKYENGIITNIPSDKIELIAQRLSVSPAYLMGWEEMLIEKTDCPCPNADNNVSEMINIFKKLTHTQQGKLIERAKVMLEDNENEAEALEKENAS